jgi:hypothetical protein
MWYSQHPDVSHLHELSCKAWVFIMTDNLKIYNRSIECVLVSYSESSKAYHCLDRAMGQIHITWNITFAESQDLVLYPLHLGVTVNIEEGHACPKTVEPTARDALIKDLWEGTAQKLEKVELQIMPEAVIHQSSCDSKLSTAGAASIGLGYTSAMD